MIYASVFDDKTILCGADGAPAVVDDVRYSETPTGSSVLNYFIKVGGKLTGSHTDDGHENITPDTAVVEEFIPEELTDKTEKRVGRFNGIISKLTGEKIESDDLTAWQRLLPGGDLHGKLIGASCYIEVNDWQGRKKFQFNNNCAKPAVLTYEQVKVQFANKAQRKKEAEAEVAALGL